MKLLLTAVILSVLAGCVVYDDGYYHRRGDDDGWHTQGDDGRHGHRHQGGQNDQGEDD